MASTGWPLTTCAAVQPSRTPSLASSPPGRAARGPDGQGRDPLILTLARGNYCPKEHQQHLALAANYPKIAVAYTQVATIATDDHHTLQEFRASVGAQWTFLSDPGRTVQQDLDIAEYTDPEHKTSCSVPPRARARSAIMVPIVDLPLFLRSAAGLCGRARPGGLVPRSSSSCPRSQSFSHTLEDLGEFRFRRARKVCGGGSHLVLDTTVRALRHLMVSAVKTVWAKARPNGCPLARAAKRSDPTDQ
jgi:hypothetical protein